MSSPKDKAIELVNKFSTVGLQQREEGIACALIAVNEIMKAPFENSYIDLIPDEADDNSWFWDKFNEFWQQVKTEIKKL
jgi:hypothetical protein